ncbi:hypothetical protein BCR41DRAFT_370273 [Lobosporangium transversale]|uniref:Uncharacterized protein n=1 Tax=Lobosporangium transversale TaxID=64571 RepID=A0A1Y2GP25_9FUNG|nr:hypothetical protein BCR41DRAFT_370273 [Lobosporangium transversale]ORZ17461.1 hypothetical protein BCR41DRAFT_370273 [Lobosporangium transversale]|eukprot:XP_021881848.1 hypothetical protein BCR41DRAFT_370273 [Lobosporangium transversale]
MENSMNGGMNPVNNEEGSGGGLLLLRDMDRIANNLKIHDQEAARRNEAPMFEGVTAKTCEERWVVLFQKHKDRVSQMYSLPLLVFIISGIRNATIQCKTQDPDKTEISTIRLPLVNCLANKTDIRSHVADSMGMVTSLSDLFDTSIAMLPSECSYITAIFPFST